MKVTKGGGIGYALLVLLERDQLLTADCWGKDVRKEIEGMPFHIEITVYLKELQVCIERIQEYLMANVKKEY